MYISVIIPLLNEEGNIDIISEKLVSIIKSISINYEIIFIDDGSTDSSLKKIRNLSNNNLHIKGISLSRNFGHQIALSAGLEHSKGDVVITMDADLQHPPEIIPKLIEKYKEGFDIVNTIRQETADSNFVKRLTSKGFYLLMNSLSDVRIEPAAADFRLMNRKTINEFLKFSEKDRFTRGLISWMGFNQAYINYSAPQRHSGISKYSLKKMFRFASDGLTSFSRKPLRISFYIGTSISIIGLIYSIYAIFEHFQGKTQPGWTSILVSILIIGGIQLISIGIIGEYLYRVFNESKNRPLYLIKEYINNTSNEQSNNIL